MLEIVVTIVVVAFIAVALLGHVLVLEAVVTGRTGNGDPASQLPEPVTTEAKPKPLTAASPERAA